MSSLDKDEDGDKKLSNVNRVVMDMERTRSLQFPVLEPEK